MKRFLICRNKNTERFVVIKNGEKKLNIEDTKLNTERIKYNDGFITVSDKYSYINIYEENDENGCIAEFDNIKLKSGDTCPWDSDYTVVYKYIPSVSSSVYELKAVNYKNGLTTYHVDSNAATDHRTGAFIFDQVFITDDGIQIGIYRDVLPIILGKPSPMVSSVYIDEIIYVNKSINKYYYAKYVGDTRFKIYNNKKRQQFLKLPENHIMDDGRMLTGWCGDELIFGREMNENKIINDITYDRFQSKKYWRGKQTLTEIINNSTNVYLNTNYRKHRSDDCYSKFILYLENKERDKNNNTDYFLLGMGEDGLVHIGNSGYLNTSCRGIKEIDIDEAILFMHKYRDLMVSRQEFEYELVNNINVEQSCVNITFESSYNNEDKNRINVMMTLNE